MYPDQRPQYRPEWAVAAVSGSFCIRNIISNLLNLFDLLNDPRHVGASTGTSRVGSLRDGRVVSRDLLRRFIARILINLSLASRNPFGGPRAS